MLNENGPFCNINVSYPLKVYSVQVNLRQLFMYLLLLLSHFSYVWLCATPQMAAHQCPRSLGFSRQEHWSGLPSPSPMHESEKWKCSHSVVTNSLRPHGLQLTRLLHPWDFPGKRTGVGCHSLLCFMYLISILTKVLLRNSFFSKIG